MKDYNCYWLDIYVVERLKGVYLWIEKRNVFGYDGMK